MPPPTSGRRPLKVSQKKKTPEQKEKERLEEERERIELKRRVVEEAPERGHVPAFTTATAFRTLPLSTKTLRGLEEAGYTTLTEIQQACIPHALAGRDILGAARTGSGKTLAFLVPLLELLHREVEVEVHRGPAAVVLSPTRELAVQIFQVLQKVGKYHSQFSVGLLMGGKKDFYTEQRAIVVTQILIATPGRLLQHLEQTPYLDMTGLRILVLDEADRILDMGFRPQLIRVLEYLPSPPSTTNADSGGGGTYDTLGQAEQQRQTLLFSATQTRDVSQLATLSLQKPEYLGVHDKCAMTTPESLQQSYIVVPLQHKLDALYSFIKSHLRCKSIVFFASCAQVRHAWELFCALQPGLPVMALHGKLPQGKRTSIYHNFCHKQYAVLFATDICARGLDFPSVDWVVQVDAPEDRDMYIHRAGRTARYRSGGNALLLLTPAEERNGMVTLIQQGKRSDGNKEGDENDDNKNNNHHGDNDEEKANKDKRNKKESSSSSSSRSMKIPLKKLSINPNKTMVVSSRAAALVASNVKLHRLAKKAFQSYLRSISLMPLQHIFKLADLTPEDLQGYATSLGLAAADAAAEHAPNLRFLQLERGAATTREECRERKNVNRKLQKLKEQIKAEKLAKKIEKLNSKEGGGSGGTVNATTTGNSNIPATTNDEDNDDDDDDLLVSKREQVWQDDDDKDNLPVVHLNQVSKSRNPKKIRVDGGNTPGKHVVFDEEGQAEDTSRLLLAANDKNAKDITEQLSRNKNELEQATVEYMQQVKERMQSNFERDRLEEKERIRLKHKKRRLDAKGPKEDGTEGPGAVLAGAVLDTGDSSSSSSDDNNNNDDGSTSESSASSSDEGSQEDERHPVPNTNHSESDSESADDDDDDLEDLKAHEERALSLIRGGLK